MHAILAHFPANKVKNEQEKSEVSRLGKTKLIILHKPVNSNLRR